MPDNFHPQFGTITFQLAIPSHPEPNQSMILSGTEKNSIASAVYLKLWNYANVAWGPWFTGELPPRQCRETNVTKICNPASRAKLGVDNEEADSLVSNYYRN